MEFYKKKYLKYKNKYLETKQSLKGGNPDKKILLMFLGGVVSTPNLIKHYTIMNEEFNKKDNYYIVIHPISLPYTINEEFKKIFNPDNIFIVDENHHLLTAWATKSLSDATLMMMQYAHIQNSGNLFDKYILLSSNCCPIYTFDKIYDYITLNDKSFINFSNGNHNNPSDVKVDPMYHYNSSLRTGSQWNILDKQHVNIFFLLSAVDIYIKEEPHYCENIKRNIETIIINKKYKQFNINFHNLRFLEIYFKLFNDRGKCTNTDEIFFQTTILHYIFNYSRETQSSLRLLKDKEKFYFEYCLLKKQLYLFNFYNTQYNIYNFPLEIKEKLKNISLHLNDKVIKYIYPLWIPKDFKDWPEQKNYVFENLSNPLNNYSMSPNTYTVLDNKVKKYIKKSYQSTYCDWLYISIEPINFLRDFNYSDIVADQNITIYLQNNPKDNYSNLNENINDCNTFIKNKLACTKDLSYKLISLRFDQCIKLPTSHPLEYSCWNIKSILNAFMLINKLKCLIPNDKTIYDTPENRRIFANISLDRYFNTFNCVYHLYKKILIYYFNINDPEIIKIYPKNWRNYKDRDEIVEDNNKDNSKLIEMILNHEQLDKILEIKIGTYITHNTLISAINEGSLFIRKCYDTSFIEEYSHILKDCNIISNQDDKIKIPEIECLYPTIPMHSWDEDFALQNFKK